MGDGWDMENSVSSLYVQGGGMFVLDYPLHYHMAISFFLSRQVHYTPLGGVNKFSNGQHCLINCTFPFQSDSKGHWTADLR